MAVLLPTTLVGSYAQPDWLIDRKRLSERFPPRTRAKELWRVSDEWLEQAQDDATLQAIREQERAGLDILTDGEMRRESYSNRFATALEGVDLDGLAIEKAEIERRLADLDDSLQQQLVRRTRATDKLDAIGGEDVLLFRRLRRAGRRFVWSPGAACPSTRWWRTSSPARWNGSRPRRRRATGT